MKRGLFLLLISIVISACSYTPSSVGILSLPENALQSRQLQTRHFETTDKIIMLNAASGVLQDLGFYLEESEASLGLLVASKKRDATNAPQVVFAVVVAVFSGTAMQAVDDTQTIRVSMVMREIEPEKSSVRVTFQRVIWNTDGDVTRVEQINDTAVYSDFFERLSKSVFLEAHDI